MAQTFRKDPLSYQPDDEVEGRYRITGILGKGGFGAVYAASHTGTHQSVALKVLTIDPTTSEDDVIQRFLREARITAQLRSHHTVRVFDVGEISNGPMFMAMELLKGPELEKVLRTYKQASQTMPEPEAAELAMQVLKSLSEAHKSGLVHRDLKPANIMLADMGEDEPVVKVLDFGIARTEDSSLTGDGKALGTPAYMSPEQCLAKDLDGRSDLYSLGIILFRCVTGRLPFESRNSLALLNLHLREPAPDPRTLNPNVSDAMADCILKALSKSPDDRFQSAREMRQALQASLGGAWAETPAVPLEALKADGDVAPTMALGLTPGPTTPPSLSKVLTVGAKDLMAEATVALDAATTAIPTPGGGTSAAAETSAGAVSPGVSTQRPAGSARWGRLALGLLAVAGLGGAAWYASTTSTSAAADARPTTNGDVRNATGIPQPGKPVVPGVAAARVPTDKEKKAEATAKVNAIKAKAEAQLAEAAKSVQEKVTHLRNAARLDPSNKTYPVLLETFEAALAKHAVQKAAAVKANEPPVAAAVAPKPERPAPRKVKVARAKAPASAARAPRHAKAQAAPKRAAAKPALPAKPKTGAPSAVQIQALD